MTSLLLSAAADSSIDSDETTLAEEGIIGRFHLPLLPRS